MRHLVDPAGITPGVASWSFLVALLVLLPATVVVQQRQLAAQAQPVVERRAIYLGAISTHVVLLLGSWLAARELVADVVPFMPVRAMDAGVALVALAIGLVPLMAADRLTDATGRARAALIAPRTRGEFAGFTGVAVTAGVAEEIAYRCVLYALLVGVTGSAWLAALVGAVAFGMAHMFQGWRSAALAALLALVAQATLGVTGNVLLVMAVHIVHDLIAGAVISRRARRDDPGGTAIAVS